MKKGESGFTARAVIIAPFLDDEKELLISVTVLPKAHGISRMPIERTASGFTCRPSDNRVRKFDVKGREV